MDLYCCFLDFAYNQWPTNKMQGISQIGEIVAERGLYKIDLVSKSATLSLSFNHIGDLTCFFFNITFGNDPEIVSISFN